MSPHGARRGRSGSGRRDPHGRIRARDTRSLPCAATSRIGQVMAVSSVHSPGAKLPRPPPTIAGPSGPTAAHPNSYPAPRASPTAEPRTAPHARSVCALMSTIRTRPRRAAPDRHGSRGERTSAVQSRRRSWRRSTPKWARTRTTEDRPVRQAALRAKTCLMTRMLSGTTDSALSAVRRQPAPPARRAGECPASPGQRAPLRGSPRTAGRRRSRRCRRRGGGS